MDEGRLHAWLDGELPRDEASEMQAHLAACAECRARLDVAREVRARAHSILRMADPPAVPMPDFATLDARRRAGLSRPVAGVRHRSLALPWAASILLALGTGWFAQELIRGSSGGRAERVAAVRSESMEAAAPPPGAGSAALDASSGPAVQAGGAGAAAGSATQSPMLERMQQETGRSAPLPAAKTEAGEQPPVFQPADRAPAMESLQVTGAPSREAERSVEPEVAVAARETPPPAAGTRRAAAPSAPRDEAATGAADAGNLAARQREPAGRGAAGGAAADAAQAAAVESPPPPPPLPPAPATWPELWVRVNRAAAVAALGAPVATIEGLAVEAYEVGNVEARTAVRVRQRLPGGETVEVLQRSGGAEIVIRAPVPPDSLARLREGVMR